MSKGEEQTNRKRQATGALPQATKIKAKRHGLRDKFFQLRSVDLPNVRQIPLRNSYRHHSDHSLPFQVQSLKPPRDIIPITCVVQANEDDGVPLKPKYSAHHS